MSKELLTFFLVIALAAMFIPPTTSAEPLFLAARTSPRYADEMFAKKSEPKEPKEPKNPKNPEDPVTNLQRTAKKTPTLSQKAYRKSFKRWHERK